MSSKCGGKRHDSLKAGEGGGLAAARLPCLGLWASAGVFYPLVGTQGHWEAAAGVCAIATALGRGITSRHSSWAGTPLHPVICQMHQSSAARGNGNQCNIL